MSPFCAPATATSIPQASISKGIEPSDAMTSTMKSASWPLARMALPSAAMSFTTPEAVSTCTTRMALISPAVSARRRVSSASADTARRGCSANTSTSTPSASAISPHPTAKRPLSSASTLSPRESTLESAASQAPWPLAM